MSGLKVLKSIEEETVKTTKKNKDNENFNFNNFEKKKDQTESKHILKKNIDEKRSNVKFDKSEEHKDSNKLISNFEEKDISINKGKKINKCETEKINSDVKNINKVPRYFIPKKKDNAQKIIILELKRLNEAFAENEKNKKNVEYKVTLYFILQFYFIFFQFFYLIIFISYITLNQIILCS